MSDIEQATNAPGEKRKTLRFVGTIECPECRGKGGGDVRVTISGLRNAYEYRACEKCGGFGSVGVTAEGTFQPFKGWD